MKILVTDRIAEEALDVLKAKHEVTCEELDHDTLREKIPFYHALIVRSRTKVSKDILDNAKNLQVIGRAGIGVDNINVEEATKKGIKVVNSPTGTTVSVAELTLGHMLVLSRHLAKADTSMKQGQWLKKELIGQELHGKTLGLVGAGRIGKALAERAISCGMDIIYFDIIRDKEFEQETNAHYHPLEKVLEEADYLSLHVPLTSSTEHLIGEKQLKKMKKTAYLINCARGGVVDEKALINALKNKEIAGAALDDFEQKHPTGEMLSLENIVLTPHLGASTREGQVRAGVVCAQQVLMALENSEPTFWVNKQ